MHKKAGALPSSAGVVIVRVWAGEFFLLEYLSDHPRWSYPTVTRYREREGISDPKTGSRENGVYFGQHIVLS